MNNVLNQLSYYLLYSINCAYVLYIIRSNYCLSIGLHWDYILHEIFPSYEELISYNIQHGEIELESYNTKLFISMV